jgi:hypothetical protein
MHDWYLDRCSPGLLSPELDSTDHLTRRSTHFLAPGRRCGHPGQQHGRRFPAVSSSTARWIRRPRVEPCLAEMTQQTHSFRASGVRSFQAACVVASEPRALRISAGVLCAGPGLVLLFAITLRSAHRQSLASYSARLRTSILARQPGLLESDGHDSLGIRLR